MKALIKKIKNPILGIVVIFIITALIGIGLFKLLFTIFFTSIALGEHFTVNELLTNISTIIGGYGSFVGGVVGVMGAFLMFQYQTKKEDDKKKELAAKNLYEMLNTSIYNTSYIVEKIVERYFKLIKYGNISKLKGDIREDIIFIYENNFNVDIEGFSYDERKRIGRFKDDINIIMNKTYCSSLIYNDEWYKHLDCFNEMFVANMTKWVSILKSNEYKYNIHIFLIHRDLMINTIEQMNYQKLIKIGNVTQIVSSSQHKFENVYKRIQEKYKNN